MIQRTFEARKSNISVDSADVVVVTGSSGQVAAFVVMGIPFDAAQDLADRLNEVVKETLYAEQQWV